LSQDRLQGNRPGGVVGLIPSHRDGYRFHVACGGIGCDSRRPGKIYTPHADGCWRCREVCRGRAHVALILNCLQLGLRDDRARSNVLTKKISADDPRGETCRPEQTDRQEEHRCQKLNERKSVLFACGFHHIRLTPWLSHQLTNLHVARSHHNHRFRSSGVGDGYRRCHPGTS
jgi:hypothetical protein